MKGLKESRSQVPLRHEALLNLQYLRMKIRHIFGLPDSSMTGSQCGEAFERLLLKSWLHLLYLLAERPMNS